MCNKVKMKNIRAGKKVGSAVQHLPIRHQGPEFSVCVCMRENTDKTQKYLSCHNL